MSLCALNDERYMALVASVYKRLQEVAETDLPLDINSIAKDIYKLVNDAKNDEEQALGLAQHVPSAVKLILDIEPALKKALRAKGLSLDALDDMIDTFGSGLEQVRDIMVDRGAEELEKKTEVGANLSTDDTPKTIENKVPDSIANLEIFHPIPLNYNTTTGTQTPDRDFQYDIMQSIVKDLEIIGAADATDYQYGYHTGFRLKPVVRDNGVALILTDNEGRILNFNSDKEVSLLPNGKEVYFFLRNNSAEKEEEFIKDVISRKRAAAAKVAHYRENPELLNEELGSFEKAFRAERARQRKITEDLLTEFNKDQKKDILLEINGGSTGYIPTGWVPLSQLSISDAELKSINNNYDQLAGKTYIQLTNSNKKIHVSSSVGRAKDVAPDLIKHMSEMLTRPLMVVEGNKQRLLTAKEKEKYFKTYLYSKSLIQKKEGGGKVVINAVDGLLTIQVKGKTFDLATTSASDIEKALLSLDDLYIQTDFPSLKSGVSDVYIINEQDNTAKRTQRNYLDFLKPYLLINTKGSDRNDLKLLNGYFGWQPVSTVMPVLPSETKEATKEPVKKAEDNNPYFKPFERSRMMKAGATKEQIDAAEKWWKESPLAKHIPLHVLTNIVNSDAWADWSLAGITLYNGSNSTDIYHEAWHAFSQLYLSPEEKKALYSDIRKMPGTFTVAGKTVAFSKATDRQAEEYIAEQFRKYAMSKGRTQPKSSLLKRIFDKIWSFLKELVGKTTPSEVAGQADQYNGLSEIFNKLYVGDINSYTPSVSNVMIDEANYGIVALENAEDILSFTDSKLLNDSIDAIISEYVTDIAKAFGARNTMKALASKANAGQTYGYVKQQIDKRLTVLTDNYKKNKDTLSAEDLQILEKDIQVLTFASDNFGKPEEALDGSQKNGVIAYHRNNSKFYEFFQSELAIEEAELDAEAEGGMANSARGGFDRSSTLDIEDEANAFTVYLIDSLIEVDSKGNYVKNRLGFPQLADPSNTWNNLAVNISGVSSIPELHNKLYSLSTKGFRLYEQILKKLGNPILKEGESKQVSEEEYRMWHMFLQDMNKPRIPMMAVTFEKEEITPESFIKRAGTKGYVVKGTNGKLAIKLDSGVELESGDLYQAKIGSKINLEPVAKSDENPEGYFSVTTEEGMPIGDAYLPSSTSITAKVGRASSDTNKVRRDWTSRFQMESASNHYITQDKNGNNKLNLANVINDFIITDNKGNASLADPTRAWAFLNAIGIYMSDNRLVRESLAKYPNEINYFADAIDKAYNAKLDVHNPIKDLFEKGFKGVAVVNDVATPKKVESLGGRLNTLAKIEVEYSGEYSALSRLMPGGKLGFEESRNSSITVINDGFNKVKDIKELWVEGGQFSYMSYMNPTRNPWTNRSVLINSLFIMDPTNPEYGTRRPGVEIKPMNLVGAQLLEEDGTEAGLGLTEMGTLDKFMTDVHALLLKGVMENPRHGSKSSSQGNTVSEIITDNPVKKEKYLYIDTFDFTDKNYESGFHQGYNIMLGYLSAEMERINKIESNWDFYSKVKNFDRGKDFMLFNDILETSTKEMLKGSATIEEARAKYKGLDNALERDIRVYFDKRVTGITQQLFDKYDGILPQAYEHILRSQSYTEEQIKTYMQNPVAKASLKNAAIRSFVYNSTIHNVEMNILYYQDTFQYNHSKDEYHKRTSMWGSDGNIFATDEVSTGYINTYRQREYAKLNGTESRAFDGTFNTAIIQDAKPGTVYYDSLKKLYTEDGVRKGLKDKALESYIEGIMDKYSQKEIVETDGQGWITIDSYRILKSLEGTWTSIQEVVYNKVIKGQNVPLSELVETFPVYKLQHTGPLALTNDMPSDSLPIAAGHKFSLFPLIPSVIQKWGPMDSLNKQMIKANMDYVLCDSSSKLSQITDNTANKGDVAFKDNNSDNILEDIKFTNNRIHLKFLKNQLVLHSGFKDTATFATQIRGLLSAGLVNEGIPVDYVNSDKKWEDLSYKEQLEASRSFAMIERFNGAVEKFIETNKDKILKQVGWSRDASGKLIQGDKQVMLNFIKKELERQDVPKHVIDELTEDASTNFSAPKIESVLMSIINNRLVRHKIRGEALVELSVAFTQQFRKPTEADLAKYGTSGLPFYEADPSGKNPTKACKVKVALSGSFENLFNALDKEGNKIAVYEGVGKERKLNFTKSLDKLNTLVRDDEWLNKGNNRKLITLTGVRIPVQGLNSMEFAEVYEFLPPEAGPIIILPTEVVTKSGTDFDVDKLTVYMPYISKSGKWMSDEDYTDEKLDSEIEKHEKDYKTLLEAYLNTTGDIKTLEKALSEKAKTNSELYSVIKDLKEEKQEDYKGLLKDLRTKLVEASDLKTLPKAVANLHNLKDQELIEVLKGIDALGELGNISNDVEAIYNDIQDLNVEMFNTIEIPETEAKAESKEIKAFKTALNRIKNPLRELKDYKKNKLETIQNTMIDAMHDILKLPVNGPQLLKPNDTHIARPISQDLEEHVQDHNFRKSLLSDGAVLSKGISPTRTVEYEFNLKKHQDNIVSKSSLGITAIDNKINAITNQSGAYMNRTITIEDAEGNPKEIPVDFRLNVKHFQGDKDKVSLSGLNDSLDENNIGEVMSQLMNGMVDAEKDAWVAFIQGNMETTPTILFLLKAGVPFEEVVYFVSNPLTREYVQEQKANKGVLAELVTKRKNNPSPSAARNKARQAMWKKMGFGGRISKSPEQLYAQVQKLAGATKFDLKIMKGSDGIVNRKDYTSNLAKAALLQFMYLEELSRGYENLKKTTNVDTKRTTSLLSARLRMVNVETLKQAKYFPEQVVDYFVNKSVLKGFFVQDFATTIFAPSFKTRSHKEIDNYLIEQLKNPAVRNKLKTETGYEEDKFVAEWKNDLMRYIFTNYVKRFKAGTSDYYKGLSTRSVEGITKAAHVKNVEGKPVMFLSLKNIKAEFENQAFLKNNTDKNSYTNQGLAPVDAIVFSPTENGKKEYENFVVEREFLRHAQPLSVVKDTVPYKQHLALFKSTNIVDKKEDESVEEYNKRLEDFAYEVWLKDKALDNTLNFNHLFRSKDGNYAQRVKNLILQYPSLAKKYSIISQFAAVNPTKKGQFSDISNLILKDGRVMKPEAATQYNIDLNNLMDPNVPKLAGEGKEEENRMISEIFQMLPAYVFMQGGMGKSEYAYMSIMPAKALNVLIQEASDNFIKSLEKNGSSVLNTYEKLFLAKHNLNNKLMRTKGIDYTNVSNRLGVNDIENSSLIFPTSRPGVYVFSSKATAAEIKELALSNPDVSFVINDYFEKTRTSLIPRSSGIRTQKNKESDYVITSENLDNIKAAVDQDIEKIKDLYKAGQKIVLSESGYAQAFAYKTPSQTVSTHTQSSTGVNEFDIADTLTPIEQNFADGQGGRQMQPRFKGKSTMDLIISGDRTRTTRAKTDIQRMVKDYSLSKISDLVGKVIRMTDKTGRQVYTRITKVAPFTQEYQDATWQKEGWAKSVTDKNVGAYPYAIEFEVVKRPTQSSAGVKPVDFTNYSGGAVGGDTVWASIGKEYNIGKQVNYRPEDIGRLTQAQKEEVETAYQQAVTSLGRKAISSTTFAGGLVRRDYLQAKAADAIFAISALVKPGEKDKKGYVNKTNETVVEGGTGYAVQMAINLGKPVYVFDQNNQIWTMYKNGSWVSIETPVLTPKFAGIGTREINEAGKQAIKDVYKKTFGESKLTEQSPLNKEFFVYLSKKLLELGYVNPGSEKAPEIIDLLSITQPITQEDIENAKKDCA